MQKNRVLRYTMFSLLYFTQGTVLSYFTALNALYFLDNGLSMTDVGIFASIAMIPFVIKIFLGMLSDRVNVFGFGHRKPYIIIGLIVQTACLVAVPFIDLSTQYWWFVALAFILQMGMALYDTCTDGLALDTTPEEEQGMIQGFMVGGRAVGIVVTASVVGLLAQNVSWSAVFWLLAAITLLPIPLVLSSREPKRTVERTFDWKAFGAFRQVPVIALAGAGFVFFLVIAGVNQIVNPFLENEFQITLSTAGFITTVWGIGVVAGSVVGGFLISKFGKLRAVYIALVLSLLSAAGLAAVLRPGLAWVFVPLFGLSYGTYQTIYFALSMNFTDKRIAASMFSILMATSNIAQGAGMALSGLLVDTINYRVTFLILGAFNFLALPLLPLIFRGKGKEVEAE